MPESFPAEIELLSRFLTRVEKLPQETAEQYQGLRREAGSLLRCLTGAVRLSVSGEFSSGKSTLVNLFVGDAVVEASVLASKLPPMIFSHGETHRIFAGKWDEPEGTIGPEVSLDAEIGPGVDYLRVHTRSDLLRDIEIIDMPGSNDPERDEKELNGIAAHADILIWCTNAVNAWRESERATWAAMPDDLTRHGILVMTHVDLKSVRKSLDRVMGRLQEETSDKFTAIIPLAAPKASKAAPGGIVSDQAEWAASGAAALIDSIGALKAQKQQEAAERVQAFVETKIIPVLEDKTAPINADQPGPETVLDDWNAALGDLAAQLDQIDDAGFIDQSAAAVRKLADSLASLDAAGTELPWLAEQMRRAADLIKAETQAENAALLLQQCDREFLWVMKTADIR